MCDRERERARATSGEEGNEERKPLDGDARTEEAGEGIRLGEALALGRAVEEVREGENEGPDETSGGLLGFPPPRAHAQSAKYHRCLGRPCRGESAPPMVGMVPLRRLVSRGGGD